MNIKLAENIKALRKERKMTQEQLAEALGVTVGAVYKWERDLSTPDISLIMEMADLFETSTDMLLGYEWRAGSAGTLLQRIVGLTKERNYADAAVEAEKALKKFPNHFEIVYQSALMYVTIHALSDVTVKMPLGELEKQLDERFYRVGRSTIINLTHISRVTKSEIKLSDNVAIPLPRGAYDGVNRAIINMR